MRVAVLLALVAGAVAFCEPFAGLPAVCTDYIPIGAPVWIDPATTQAATAQNLTVATGALPLLPPACASPAIVAACLSQFRECGDDFLPRPVCPNICTEFRGNCSSIPIVAARLPDCSMMDVVNPTQMFYQDSRPSTTGNGTELCLAPSSTPSAVGCGSVPFPFKTNTKTGGSCQLFLLVPWAANFRIKNPFYPLFFLIAALWLSFGYSFSIFVDLKTWICKDDFHARSQSNSAACWFQGAGLHYGVLTGATTITVILYHLLNVLKQNKFQLFGEGKLIPFRPLWCYIVFAFVMPIAFIIATSASFGYSAENAMVCLPDAIAGNRWKMDAVFFFPVQVLLTADVVLIIILFYSIYRLGSWRALRSQVRLLALCLYYMTVMGYGQGYLIYSRATLNELKTDITHYVYCLLGAPDDAGRYYTTPPGKQCERYWIDPYPDYWARWFSQLFGLSTGIALVVIFYNAECWKAWRALLTGQFQQLKTRSYTTSHSASPSSSPQVSAHRDSGGLTNESRF